jgi:hypothetical protein
MIAYASSTGTKRNLAALKRHGWRIFRTPFTREKDQGMGYALDNGAWTAFQQETTFDEEAFTRMVYDYGDAADFIVVPDIVAGGGKSLSFSRKWLPRLRNIAPLLLAVQDGMTPQIVAPLLDHYTISGIFVGGSTEWKLDQMPLWGEFAQGRTRKCHLHIARVNTRRRIRQCHFAGADSFDGTSVTRFAVTIHPLDDERRQPALPYKGAGLGAGKATVQPRGDVQSVQRPDPVQGYRQRW